MADTIRSRADLAAALADNTIGDITPQDLRDFLISTDAADGSVFLTATAATVLTGAAAAIEVAGTTTLGLNTNMSMPADWRIRNDALTTMRFSVNADLSMTSGTNNVVVTFYIAKNGVIELGSSQQRKIGTGADVGSLGLNWVVDLAATDYISVFVKADVTNNLTIIEGNIQCASRLI